MIININEGLRLKNEIKEIIDTLKKTIVARNVAFGDTYEDGVLSFENEQLTFVQAIEVLKLAFQYSEEINAKIAQFNREHGIDVKVRTLKNKDMLKTIYETHIEQFKPRTENRWETVGNERKKVVREYKPLISAKEAKEKIYEAKSETRQIQAEIERINQKEIEVSFDYTDIDKLHIL